MISVHSINFDGLFANGNEVIIPKNYSKVVVIFKDGRIVLYNCYEPVCFDFPIKFTFYNIIDRSFYFVNFETKDVSKVTTFPGLFIDRVGKRIFQRCGFDYDVISQINITDKSYTYFYTVCSTATTLQIALLSSCIKVDPNSQIPCVEASNVIDVSKIVPGHSATFIYTFRRCKKKYTINVVITKQVNKESLTFYNNVTCFHTTLTVALPETFNGPYTINPNNTFAGSAAIASDIVFANLSVIAPGTSQTFIFDYTSADGSTMYTVNEVIYKGINESSLTFNVKITCDDTTASITLPPVFNPCAAFVDVDSGNFTGTVVPMTNPLSLNLPNNVSFPLNSSQNVVLKSLSMSECDYYTFNIVLVKSVECKPYAYQCPLTQSFTYTVLVPFNFRVWTLDSPNTLSLLSGTVLMPQLNSTFTGTVSFQAGTPINLITLTNTTPPVFSSPASLPVTFIYAYQYTDNSGCKINYVLSIVIIPTFPQYAQLYNNMLQSVSYVLDNNTVSFLYFNPISPINQSIFTTNPMPPFTALNIDNPSSVELDIELYYRIVFLANYSNINSTNVITVIFDAYLLNSFIVPSSESYISLIIPPNSSSLRLPVTITGSVLYPITANAVINLILNISSSSNSDLTIADQAVDAVLYGNLL